LGKYPLRIWGVYLKYDMKSSPWDAKKILNTVFILFSITILFFLLKIAPICVDYETFIGDTRGWSSGYSLYQTGGFYNFPHSLILLYPLSLLPIRIGQSVLNIISLIAIAWSVRELVGKLSVWALCVVWINLFTLTLFIYGQWDGLILAGVALSVYALRKRQPVLLGVALSILFTKPNNIIPVVLLLIWLIRDWPIRDWVKVAIVPGFCLVFSFLACGLNWPVRYITHYLNTPPAPDFNMSFWIIYPLPVAVVFSAIFLMWLVVTVKRTLVDHQGDKSLVIPVALLSGLLVSPHVMGYHFIMATPALAWLALKNKWLSGLAWIASFAPLFTEITGVQFFPRMVYLYCIAFGVVWVMLFNTRSQALRQP
jgi:hypothetical protein